MTGSSAGVVNVLLQFLNIDTSMPSFASMVHHTVNPDMVKLVMPEIASVTKRLYQEITNETIEEAEQWL